MGGRFLTHTHTHTQYMMTLTYIITLGSVAGIIKVTNGRGGGRFAIQNRGRNNGHCIDKDCCKMELSVTW
jgi:hypothetical protein